jgi:pimeloyl-ACP methyl ester carboxylesterase
MEKALIHFKKRGIDVHLSDTHGESTTQENAARIAEQIHRLRLGDQRKVVLVGHSKGGIDACAAVAELGSAESMQSVAGIVAVQTPFAGSPVATDVFADERIMELTGSTLATMLPRSGITRAQRSEQLLKPIECMTYTNRAKQVMHSTPLPASIPCVSFHTGVSRSSPSLLSASAAFMSRRYGAENDGAVCRADAEIPGSVAARPSEECDHMQAEFTTTWPPQTKMPLSSTDAVSSSSIGSLIVRANQAVSSLVSPSAQHDPSQSQSLHQQRKRLRARQGELHEALVVRCLEHGDFLQSDIEGCKAVEREVQKAKKAASEMHVHGDGAAAAA